MKKENNSIILASLLFLLGSILLIPMFKVFASIYLSLGILLLSYFFITPSELEKKKIPILILAIISIFLNLPAAICLFVVFDNITTKNNEIDNNINTPLSKEIKKTNSLLKLGIGMILLSGILLVTTNWTFLSSIGKVAILAILGIIFMIFSTISEKTIKIEATTKAYYILGLSFFILSWVGICYFKIISYQFSYSGIYNHGAYALTFLLIASLCYLTNMKFKDRQYLYLGHSIMYLVLLQLFLFIGMDIIKSILIMSIITLIINLIKKKSIESLQQINIVIGNIYWLGILLNLSSGTLTVLLITSLINIINLLFLVSKNDSTIIKFSTILISYILLIANIINTSFITNKCIFIFIGVSLLSLLIRYIKSLKKENIIIIDQLIYNFITIICLMVISMDYNIQYIEVSLTYFIMNFLSVIQDKKDTNLDRILQPFVIYLLINSIIKFISNNTMDIDSIYINFIIIYVLSIIHFLIKPKNLKNCYFAWLLIINILMFLAISMELNGIKSLLILISTIYIYINVPFETTAKQKKIIAYIYLLFNINLVIKSISITDYLSSLILLGIITILILIENNQTLKKVNYFAVVFPIVQLCEIISDKLGLITFNYIYTNIIQLYILALIIKLFVKNQKTKDMIATIGLSFIMMQIIFVSNLYVGIYIGMVSVIMIFLLFHKKDFYKLYITNIIVAILNIISQLFKYWRLVPLWVYLFITGLIIASFVTYKELKRQNIAPKTNSEINTPNQQQIGLNFCPKCGFKYNGENFCRNCGYKIKN